MDYHKKYLKYHQKYLNLKNSQFGGNPFTSTEKLYIMYKGIDDQNKKASLITQFKHKICYNIKLFKSTIASLKKEDIDVQYENTVYVY